MGTIMLLTVISGSLLVIGGFIGICASALNRIAAALEKKGSGTNN